MSDSAAVAVGWIAGSALVLSIYAVVRGEMRSNADKRRRRRLGPADEVRNAATDLRTSFVAMASDGGWHVNRFLDEEHKGMGQRTADVRGRVEDVALSGHLEVAEREWDTAFALAPPVRVTVLGTPPQPEELRDEARLTQQVATADRGREACDDALRRLSELERL